MNDHHSKYEEYSQYGISELLLTERKVVISFRKPDQNFVVEDLTNIRKTAKPQSKKLRTYLNRWP